MVVSNNNRVIKALNTLRLTISKEDHDTCEELAKQAISNCQQLGSQPKFQTKELENKIIGYLGVLKFAQAMKNEGLKGFAKMDASGQSDEGDDWVSPSNVKVDVKTRKWSVPPRPWHYWPIIKSNADHHPPDVYVLITIHKSLNNAWIVGGMKAKQFKETAELKKPGDSLGSCKNRVEAYALKYHQITWGYNELVNQLKKLRRCDF